MSHRNVMRVNNILLACFILQTTMTMLATAQQAPLRRLRSVIVLLYQRQPLLPLPSARK